MAPRRGFSKAHLDGLAFFPRFSFQSSLHDAFDIAILLTDLNIPLFQAETASVKN